MKYLDHIILDTEFSTPISSPYVELFTFIFCFVEKLDSTPFPRESRPLCVLESINEQHKKRLTTI